MTKIEHMDHPKIEDMASELEQMVIAYNNADSGKGTKVLERYASIFIQRQMDLQQNGYLLARQQMMGSVEQLRWDDQRPRHRERKM